jgi:predicted nucleic acid-binding protein
MFANPVFDVDEDVLLTWSLLAHRGRRAGRTYSQEDLLLAATAIFYDLILVTRNTRDFTDLPVQLINPWE